MRLVMAIAVFIIVMNILFSFSLIFIERKDSTTTWAWLLIMIMLPGIGFVIYLLLGQNLSRERLFKEKKVIDETKRKEILKEYDGEDAGWKAGEEFLDLRMMNFNHCGSKYTSGNETEIYFDGEDKFFRLLEDLNEAKSYIHMEYYIFRNETIGTEILRILEKKAEEGLEIRLLVDAMGSYKMTKNTVKKLKANGGKFEIFFPGILPHINTRINYRNHRKIVVIDGEVGYTGGFNVGKEYVNEDEKIGFWRDTHIRIKGEAVNDLNERFLLDWCYASGERIEDFTKYYPKDPFKDGDKGIQIITSGPDHREEYIKHAYIKMINNAKKSIYIQTPYFVPDEPIRESLKLAALSGVDVRIIIPGKPDHVFMKWAASSYIGDIIGSGGKVYYYENGFIHSKTIVVDGKVSSIGTANMDIRSFKLNFEVNAFIFDPSFAKEMENQFFQDINESELMTKEEYNSRSPFLKMKESIVRLIAPIL